MSGAFSYFVQVLLLGISMSAQTGMDSDNIVAAPASYKSAVWKHFGFKLDNAGIVDRTFAICRLCLSKVKYTGSTTNMSAHLKRHHPMMFCTWTDSSDTAGKITASSSASKPTNSCVIPGPRPSPSSGGSSGGGQLRIKDSFKSKLAFSSVRAKTISKSIGIFMAADLRPYSVVETAGFKQMVATLDPKYIVPSRAHFSQSVIPDLYIETRVLVERFLSQSPIVCITTDGWTSRATESFVTITAHSIDQSWTLHEHVLQTRPLAESHTGVNIAKVLDAAVEEWKLHRFHGEIPIVTDNASNMDTAVRESQHVGPHIGCFAHTINLACQRGLQVNTVSRLLGRVRRIVSFFHRSTTAAAMLKTKQKLLELPVHKLVIDVQTRWNSAFDMLSRYVEQQPAIMAVLMDKNIRKNISDVSTLSEQDVTYVENIIAVLDPLKTVTTLLCDAKSPTASLILPLKERLITSLQGNPDESPLIQNLKAAICTDLAKRYTNPAIDSFLWQCAAMDPRFRSLATLPGQKRFAVYSSLTVRCIKILQSEPVAVAPTIKTENAPDLQVR